MNDSVRIALEFALDEAERARREHLARAHESEAVICALRAALDPGRSLVPLAEAAWVMQITDVAARQRAKRGAGEKIEGRWFFRSSYVERHRRRAPEQN